MILATKKHSSYSESIIVTGSELQTLNVKTWTLNKSNLDFDPFDKQLCLDKNYNIFQTTRFKHTMIFLKLTG